MTPRVRPARPEEAAEIAALIRRSITELCARDHGDDPEILAAWLGNKTPEGVGGWFATHGQRILVSEAAGRIVGVAAARTDGCIVLNYVSPDFTRRGVGTSLLAELEAWVRSQGAPETRLESTATARAFYLARGYREGGPPQGGAGGFRMVKPYVVPA